MKFSQKGRYALPLHVAEMWKWFFYQYSLWQAEYQELGTLRGRIIDTPGRGSGHGDPVAAAAVRRAELSQKMDFTEKVARLSDPDLYPWIFKALTNEEVTYITLKMQYDIPCSDATFYDRLRRCYWLADQIQSWGFVYKDFKRGKLVFLDRDGNEVP